MTNRFLLCIGAILLITAGSLAQSRGEKNSSIASPSVGNIRNTSVVEGCSCSLSRGKNSIKYVFLSDYEKKSAWINVDGRDIKLKFAGTTQIRRRNRPDRRGDKFTDKWGSPGVTVRIDYIVTAPMTDGNEATDYATTITVTKNGKGRSIIATGNCGC
jgi:hypothetical protein